MDVPPWGRQFVSSLTITRTGLMKRDESRRVTSITDERSNSADERHLLREPRRQVGTGPRI